MNTPQLKLNDRFSIPQIGLGLWQVKNEQEFNIAFEAALKAGYRHFDTAQYYENEQMLGEAWTKSGLTRKDFYITTKIANSHFGMKRTQTSFEVSLKKLKTNYVDLLLLHFPVTFLRKNSWLALEQIQKEGKARSIGVSNYTVRHLEEMEKYTSIIPAINQVELHVFLQQPELLDYCRKKGIIVEAYSPLTHGKEMNEPVISAIAKKHNKSYAQIMLRWCIQKDLVVIPKSVTPVRINENIAIFDFTLDSGDLKKLASLNRNLRTCWDPTLVP